MAETEDADAAWEAAREVPDEEPADGEAGAEAEVTQPAEADTEAAEGEAEEPSSSAAHADEAAANDEEADAGASFETGAERGEDEGAAEMGAPAGGADDEEDDEPPPPKPKRAQTPWGYYIEEVHGNRPSKEAGDGWKALSEEEKEPYNQKGARDKERYEEERSAFRAWEVTHPAAAERLFPKKVEEALLETSTYLNPGTVRRMVKYVGEGCAISREAFFLVGKSTELLLSSMAEQCAVTARRAKRRAINGNDLAQARATPPSAR